MSKLDLAILERLGKLTRQIRKEISQMPKEGMDITEIIDYVEKRIFDEGFLPAFPCTVSVNEVAAHYTVFDEGYTLCKGDLIKIDFGLSHEGFITDNAVSIEIGTDEYTKLMQANLEGLNAAFETANINITMSDIGSAIDSVAQKYGFNTIHNLSGHQVAQNKLHAGVSVPNYANGNTATIQDNMALAIEPFFTLGEPKVKSCGPSNIVHLISSKPVRDPIAKKVLTYIKENFPHLPFSKRWLLKEVMENLCPARATNAFDKRRVLYAVNLLKQAGILYEYEALATVDGAKVSQYEDTIVFAEGKKQIITRLQ